MARRVSLFRTFSGKRFIKEGIRPSFQEARRLGSELKAKGYKIQIIKVSSHIHLKGYAWAVYARS